MTLSKPLEFSKCGRAAIYILDSSTVQTINASNQWHGVRDFSEGTDAAMRGFTRGISSSGVVTSTASGAGGVLRCNDTGHALSTGQYITLNNMGDSAHNGVTAVTVINSSTFDCDDINYNSGSAGGNWQRPTSLILDNKYDGDYQISVSISYESLAADKPFEFQVCKNANILDSFKASQWADVSSGGTGTDEPMNCGLNGIVTLAEDDAVFLVMLSDGTNLEVQQANFSIIKI